MLTGVILAAGRGSRLDRFTAVIPKSMSYLPRGRFLIDYQIDYLLSAGALPILIVVGYLGEDIEGYAARKYPQCRIIRQSGSLGTAADGLIELKNLIDGDFLVIHGDHYFSENPIPTLLRDYRKGAVTFLLDPPSKSSSFGYGQRCLVSRTWSILKYPLLASTETERKGGNKEMVLVDGCMTLPA